MQTLNGVKTLEFDIRQKNQRFEGTAKIGGKDAPGRLQVQATIDSLVQQSKDLTQAASVLGIKRLNLAEPG